MNDTAQPQGVLTGQSMAGTTAQTATAGTNTCFCQRERIKVIRCGWLAFEGFGRPFEAWTKTSFGSWRTRGRSFTYMGARRKAKKKL